MLGISFDKLFGNEKPTSFLVLDIGSDFVKALIFELIEKEDTAEKQLEVIGAGKVPQNLSDMQMGVVADINAVAENVQKALDEALLSCEIEPKSAVLGASGMLVEGMTTRVRLSRKNPDQEMNAKELNRLTKKIRDAAFIEAAEQIALSRGQSNLDIEIIDSEITGMEVDGFPVSEPTGFKGARLDVSYFTSICVKNNLHVLESVVRAAGLKPVAVTSNLYALLKALLIDRESSEFSSLLIDVGGGTTDAAVVFSGSIVSTETLTVGGQDFTRALARENNLRFSDAETLKLKYSKGNLEAEKQQQVASVLDSILETWVLGISEALDSMEAVEEFPNRVLLCGGGAQLPGLKTELNESLPQAVSFAEKPQVELLTADAFDFFNDQTNKAVSAQWVPSLCLGYFYKSNLY
ncbi:MAG: cell division FtsA domain-containing protein [Patescibacteria group bacterium]